MFVLVDVAIAGSVLGVSQKRLCLPENTQWLYFGCRVHLSKDSKSDQATTSYVSHVLTTVLIIKKLIMLSQYGRQRQ